MKLISGFCDSVSVITVHHKDKTLCVLEVMPPQWPNLSSSQQKF